MLPFLGLLVPKLNYLIQIKLHSSNWAMALLLYIYINYIQSLTGGRLVHYGRGANF